MTGLQTALSEGSLTLLFILAQAANQPDHGEAGPGQAPDLLISLCTWDPWISKLMCLVSYLS